MTNPAENIAYVLASESGIPVNKIFSPLENDNIRLERILREALANHIKMSQQEAFHGKIEGITVTGPHSNDMTFDHTKIIFNGIPFEKVFGIETETVYKKSLEDLKNYGIKRINQTGATATDTVYNTLLPITQFILDERNDITHRGGIYYPNEEIYTTAQFKLARGIVSESDIVKYTMDKNSPQYLQSIAKEKALIEALIQNGLISKITPRTAEVPTVQPYEKKPSRIEILQERVDIIEREIVKIKENSKSSAILALEAASNIDTAVYMESLNKKAVLRHRFNGSLQPSSSDYRLNLMSVFGNAFDRENSRTGLHLFDAKHEKVYIVSKRSHSGQNPDFRMLEYRKDKLDPVNISDPINIGVPFEIFDLCITNRPFIAYYTDKGVYLAEFDKKMITHAQLPLEISGIVPYGKSFIGIGKKSLYSIEDKIRTIHEFEHPVIPDAKVVGDMLMLKIPGTSNTLVYDIKSGRQKIFPSIFRGMDIIFDSQGIQAACNTGNGIEIYDCMPGELFESQPRAVITEGGYASMRVTIPQRNYLLLNPDEKKMHILYHNGRSQHIEETSIKDFKDNKVVING